jgi:FG-GAP-like repeat
LNRNKGGAHFRSQFVNQLFRVSWCGLVLAITGHVSAAFGQAGPVFTDIPHFLTPTNYSVPGATMVALADVNGDGILDIVSANGDSPTGDGGVSVLLGNGDGTFKPAVKIAAGGSPIMVVVGDFNNDGKQDIAVSNSATSGSGLPAVGGPPVNTVSIYFGNGDGTFQAPINTPTGGAVGMFAADFNNDGKLDLAITTSTIVQILLNKGNGTFTLSDTTVNGFSSRILGGDFNGDGNQDLLVFGSEMLGNGDGTFTVSTGQVLRGAGFLADFNGDGIPDLTEQDVVSGRFFVGLMAFGLPGGTWAPSFITSVTSDGPGVAADFGGDGKMDIYGNGWAPLNQANDNPPAPGGLFLGHGDGTFTRVSYGLSQFFGAGFTAVGDLDGNGSPDLVLTGSDANGELGVQVALNTFGHPPLVARLTASAAFTVGGGPAVTGTVSLGGPAPAGGALITLSSSSPSVTFPNGKTVTVPAGSRSATFTMATSAVVASAPVTISATYHTITQKTSFTLVNKFSLVSISPVTLIGEFGGDAGVATVTLSGPASDRVVVNLVSANPALLKVPARVAVAPGATTATFPIAANHVAATTVVTVTGTLAGIARSAAVTIKAQPAIVVIQKAEYVVRKGQLTVQATSTNIEPVGSAIIPSLKVYNASTGALIGSIRLANVGKGNVGQFTGVLTATGSLTSIAVQDFAGGLAIGPVAQK